MFDAVAVAGSAGGPSEAVEELNTPWPNMGRDIALARAILDDHLQDAAAKGEKLKFLGDISYGPGDTVMLRVADWRLAIMDAFQDEYPHTTAAEFRSTKALVVLDRELIPPEPY